MCVLIVLALSCSRECWTEIEILEKCAPKSIYSFVSMEIRRAGSAKTCRSARMGGALSVHASFPRQKASRLCSYFRMHLNTALPLRSHIASALKSSHRDTIQTELSFLASLFNIDAQQTTHIKGRKRNKLGFNDNAKRAVLQ